MKFKISPVHQVQIILTVVVLLVCFGLGYLATSLIISYFQWDLNWFIKILRTIEAGGIFFLIFYLQKKLHERCRLLEPLTGSLVWDGSVALVAGIVLLAVSAPVFEVEILLWAFLLSALYFLISKGMQYLSR